MEKINVTTGDLGPQHKIIENEFYRIETLPSSGQIWHMQNKLGSNADWFHNEWESNKDKGGDPCHWAPNSWVGYPERVGSGFENISFGDIEAIDWHYVFGWDNPETVINEYDDSYEIIRRGVVFPHPEHSNPKTFREEKPLIWAEVTYKFYHGSPYFFQSSRIRTLAPVPVFFIRNCQYVFQYHNFSHMLVAPEQDGVKPKDKIKPSVLPLMSYFRNKPFEREHTLSNILPSKLDYTGFINEKTKDGFALFHLKEENTNLKTGKASYGNHCTLFTELSDWAVYFCRAFSYTNQRFNPENMQYLPEGEEYYEENMALMFEHNSVEETLEYLDKMKFKFKAM